MLTGRIRWVTFLLLLPALLLGIGGEALPWFAPTALAAGKHLENTSGDCKERHQPSFGGTIVVDTGEVVCGDLTSFGGTVAINGEVRGDVVSFGGEVVIAGTVDGNVDIYGGTVTLQNGSDVRGDLNLYAGGWARGDSAQLNGALIDHTRRIEQLFFSSSEFHFPFWPILTWVVLGLLLTWLLPEHVMFVRTTVASRPRRSLLIGLLSALLALPVVVVLVALILTIPVAIIVALGLIIAWAFGTVSIGWLVGEHVLHMIAPQHNTRPFQVAVGLTVLVLAGSLPYIGYWISIGAGLLGLGAVFLSRFGTRLYSQPKQPLTL
jgi:hypothetical protein